MDNPNNLPAKVGIRSIFENNPSFGKFADSLRRTGVIMGSSLAILAGLGITAAPLPGAAIVGWGMFAAGLTKFAENVTLKTEPTLLFGSKKQGDEIGIYQNVLNFSDSTRMTGYDSIEKMSMMGIQTLVGLSRYKQNLKDTPFELDDNGETRIYSQKFATLTHGINLENFKALEALGYIKIDSINSQFEAKSVDEKIAALTAKKGEPKRSYLLIEKIGFGNWTGAKNAVKAILSGDKKQKENNSVEMQKISFRLTDKPIDFEEIKQFKNPQYRKSLPPELAKAASKIGMMARVMEKRELDIKKDSFGRDVIKYPARSKNAEINKKRAETKKENALRAKANKAKVKLEAEKEKFETEIKDGVEMDGKVDASKTLDKQPEQQLTPNKDDVQEL